MAKKKEKEKGKTETSNAEINGGNTDNQLNISQPDTEIIEADALTKGTSEGGEKTKKTKKNKKHRPVESQAISEILADSVIDPSLQDYDTQKSNEVSTSKEQKIKKHVLAVPEQDAGGIRTEGNLGSNQNEQELRKDRKKKKKKKREHVINTEDKEGQPPSRSDGTNGAVTENENARMVQDLPKDVEHMTTAEIQIRAKKRKESNDEEATEASDKPPHLEKLKSSKRRRKSREKMADQADLAETHDTLPSEEIFNYDEPVPILPPPLSSQKYIPFGEIGIASNDSEHSNASSSPNASSQYRSSAAPGSFRIAPSPLSALTASSLTSFAPEINGPPHASTSEIHPVQPHPKEPGKNRSRKMNGTEPSSSDTRRAHVVAKEKHQPVINVRLEMGSGAAPELAPSSNTPANQEVLASKWLMGPQLAELMEHEGLKFRQGKFTAEEDAVLKIAIESFKEQHALTDQGVTEIIYAAGRNVRSEQNDFWAFLARSLVDRPLQSVYHHTKRLMQTSARQGQWLEEEDQKLRNAVAILGPQWKKVSPIVGRWDSDCRDRWRNYIKPGAKKMKGKWTPEEENALRDIVLELKQENQSNQQQNGVAIQGEGDLGFGSEFFWTTVARRFPGGSRTRHQCRIKWNDNMANKILTKEGTKVRWGRRDAFIMVMKLASLDAERESEIDWRLLPDPDWNWWSPHVLGKRFVTMKARAKKELENPEAPLPQIIAWLKREQDAIPRDEVKVFMSLKPGENREEEASDGDEQEVAEHEGAPEISTSARTPSSKGRKKGKSKAVETVRKQIRSQEFVDSTDDEEGRF